MAGKKCSGIRRPGRSSLFSQRPALREWWSWQAGCSSSWGFSRGPRRSFFSRRWRSHTSCCMPAWHGGPSTTRENWPSFIVLSSFICPQRAQAPSVWIISESVPRPRPRPRPLPRRNQDNFLDEFRPGAGLPALRPGGGFRREKDLLFLEGIASFQRIVVYPRPPVCY